MRYRLQNNRYDRVASNRCFNKTGFESYVANAEIYFNNRNLRKECYIKRKKTMRLEY